MKVILITGVSGTGKSHLAKRIAYDMDDSQLIYMDEHRFGDNWFKKPYDEFREGVFNEITSNENNKIIEGAYFDVSDKTNARQKLFYEIIKTFDTEVIILKPKSRKQQLLSIITRSLKRYAGEEEQNSSGNVEKPENVTGLILKNMDNYDLIQEKYTEFYDMYKDRCVIDVVEMNYI